MSQFPYSAFYFRTFKKQQGSALTQAIFTLYRTGFEPARKP